MRCVSSGGGRFRALRALPAVLVLAACASAPAPSNTATAPLSPRPIDSSYLGFRYEEGDSIVGAYYVYNVFRTFDSDGKLGVCGAYGINLPEASQAQLARRFRSANAYVDIGGAGPDKPGLRFSPAFMAPVTMNEPREMLGRPAGCVQVDTPWSDSLDISKRRVPFFFRLGNVNEPG